MSEVLQARAWLDSREPGPPARLLARMRDALEQVSPPPADLPAQLGEAALVCLRAALARGNDRGAALELLAADALLTYGCEAAVEDSAASDVEVATALDRFAETYGAAALARLLPRSA